MSILSKLTQRHTVKHKSKKATGRQREQLNVEIDPALNEAIGDLAKLFFTNKWVIAEHIAQIGVTHLKRISQSVKTVQILREHLANSHATAHYLDADEGVLLRLGELELPTWKLTWYAQKVRTAGFRLELAFRECKRTGNFEVYDVRKREFLLAVSQLADLLTGHPVANERVTREYAYQPDEPSESEAQKNEAVP